MLIKKKYWSLHKVSNKIHRTEEKVVIVPLMDLVSKLFHVNIVFCFVKKMFAKSWKQRSKMQKNNGYEKYRNIKEWDDQVKN